MSLLDIKSGRINSALLPPAGRRMIMKLKIIKGLALMDDQGTFGGRPSGSGDEG